MPNAIKASKKIQNPHIARLCFIKPDPSHCPCLDCFGKAQHDITSVKGQQAAAEVLSWQCDQDIAGSCHCDTP